MCSEGGDFDFPCIIGIAYGSVVVAPWLLAILTHRVGQIKWFYSIISCDNWTITTQIGSILLEFHPIVSAITVDNYSIWMLKCPHKQLDELIVSNDQQTNESGGGDNLGVWLVEISAPETRHRLVNTGYWQSMFILRCNSIIVVMM